MSTISPSLRNALAGFALTAAAVAGWQQLSAQAIASHNSQGPVDFSADRIELQDRQDRVVLAGSVVIKQGNLDLRAARVTLAFTDAGRLQLNRLDATGGVTVIRGNETARGAVAVYDFNRRLITMSGGVALRRGGDNLNGGRLTIDLRTGLSSVDGSGTGSASGQGGGRVSGTFTVPDDGSN
jgi:lipopolysaccharide export system protein LptA